MKKFFLKVSPFLLSLLVGILFYYLSVEVPNFANLFVNISAAFISIPLIYIFYNLAQHFVEKELRKEIIEYIKYKVDGEILEIINWLQKMIYPLQNTDRSFRGIEKFLDLEKNEIVNIIKDKDFLGFQLFKKWDIKDKDIDECLNNNLIIKYLSDEQLISLIKIIGSVNALNIIHKDIESNFINMNKRTKDYEIIKPDSKIFENRLILLKKISGNMGKVVDYGDFENYQQYQLVNLYKIKDDSSYSIIIYRLISNIKKWFKLTNYDVILNPNKTRIRCHKGVFNNATEELSD